MSTATDWLDHDAAGGIPDPYARYLAGEPLHAGGPERRCPDLESLTAYATDRLGAKIPRDLADALTEQATRLGGGDTSLEAIADAREGRAVLVFAGQQPGLLAGPLYTLHKAATAVAAARALTVAGVRAHPAFWIAADDADLDETGTAYAPGPDRGLRKATLTGKYPAGTACGDVPSSENVAVFETLFPEGPEELRAFVRGCGERGRDIGTFLAVVLHRLFGMHGIVPVDSRTPALRRAAAPLVRRYIEVHADVAARVNAAGAAIEASGGARPIHETSAASALFAVDEEGRRAKLETPEAAGALDPERISTAVVLRPFVQEAVFPSAGMVVGPGELAYLVQTESAAELLGVRRSPFIPRLSATWVDETLVELAGIAGGRWTELFGDPTAAVEARLRREVPEPLARALETLGTDTARGFAEIQEIAEREGDKGLSQMTEASRKKADYQINRLDGYVVDRARKSAAKRGLVLTNVGDMLTPRNGGQERTFSSMWPIGELSSEIVGAATVALAREHLERLSKGETAHALVSFAAMRTRAKEESWGERCESA